MAIISGNKMLSRLKDGAKAHGEVSAPDMEVGDLYDILDSCWRRLSLEQKRRVYADCEEVVGWLDEPEE